MPRVRRALVRAFAAGSIFIFAATLVLWARGAFVVDRLVWRSGHALPEFMWLARERGVRLGGWGIQIWHWETPTSTEGAFGSYRRPPQAAFPVSGVPAYWASPDAPEFDHVAGFAVRLSSDDGFLAVPYWFVAAVTVVVPARRLAAAHRVCRRAAAGRCPACGYDIRATPARCPECGVRQTEAP